MGKWSCTSRQKPSCLLWYFSVTKNTESVFFVIRCFSSRTILFCVTRDWFVSWSPPPPRLPTLVGRTEHSLHIWDRWGRGESAMEGAGARGSKPHRAPPGFKNGCTQSARCNKQQLKFIGQSFNKGWQSISESSSRDWILNLDIKFGRFHNHHDLPEAWASHLGDLASEAEGEEAQPQHQEPRGHPRVAPPKGAEGTFSP